MHNTVLNLLKISKEVKKKFESNTNLIKSPEIIAVSKTFGLDHILPSIQHGHIHYGENKVQEAVQKWTEIKKEKPHLKLHLVGRLQTNKVKMALKLFDYIHSLDSKKLADRICRIQQELEINKKLCIQVNIGNENQKSGVEIKNLTNLVNYCKDLGLNIIGLMCIPPIDTASSDYFKKMVELNETYNFEELSMGMSSDFLEASQNNATFVRIGSNIFGQRS